MSTSRSAEESLRLTLPSGRKVSYAVYGQEGGHPVVFCHGFPGSRLQAHYLDAAARERDLLVIAPDRPGIGRSTDYWFDGVSEWVSDAAAFLDALGIAPFSAVGVSGGGPYALAMAALLGPRVRNVALVASPCELDAGALKRLGRFDATALRLARRFPRLVRLATRHTIAGKRRNRLGWFRMRLDGGDRQTIASQHVSQSLAANRAEALRGGTSALERESVLYTRPWGFELADVACRVDVWHGCEDRLTPPFMATRLAEAIPHATLHMVEGEGHFSLLPRIVGAVLDGIGEG